MGTITIAGAWRVSAPIASVWDVVSDLQTWPQWWPAIRDASLVDEDADVARLTFDTPPPLRPLVVGLSVVERSAPHRLQATTTDGPLTGDASLVLDEHEDHTAVAFDLRLRVRSLLFRPLEGVLAGATRSGGKARLSEAGDDLAALAGGHALEHDL